MTPLRRPRHALSMLIAASISFVPVPPAWADPPNPVQMHTTSSIWFNNWVGLSDATLTVIAPNGKQVTIFEKTRSPRFRLSGRNIQNGAYHYELTAATEERIPYENDVREFDEGIAPPTTIAKPFYKSGSFLVVSGVIVKPEEIEEETARN